MATQMISRMTTCSHYHLLHPFCPRQNSTEKVSNFVLYAFGAAVACWALYQISRAGSSSSHRTLEPQDAALVESPPHRSALELTRKFSKPPRSTSTALSTEKGTNATPTSHEIADHFCRIVETARKQPGKPVAYDWTQKGSPVSDSTPRLTVTFMKLSTEGETVKEEVALIANSALPGHYIRWTSKAESNIRKGHYPAGMELKTLLDVLSARPRVFPE